jgi:hypothetical protein
MTILSGVPQRKRALSSSEGSDNTRKRARKGRKPAGQPRSEKEQHELRTGKFSVRAIALDSDPEQIIMKGNALAATMADDSSYTPSIE